MKISKYHITWTTKYRKKYLIGLIKKTLEKILIYKAKDININIEKYEIMPDHIHLFISIKSTDNISNIVKLLKGYSSFEIRKELKLHNYKSFWGRGYFCESIGHISEKIIKKYIDNQWMHYK